MFTITDEPTFTHDVKVKVPCDGGFRDETIAVTYRVIPQEESDAHDLYSAESSIEWLKKIVVSLDKLVDQNKQAVSYSEAVRDQVLKMPYARLAIAQGYFAAMTKAREGN